MNKKDYIYYTVIVVLFAVAVFAGVHIYNTNIELNTYKRELNTYKRYYNASEKLFDEIEEDNETYFDSNRGIDYLLVRKEIMYMNN